MSHYRGIGSSRDRARAAGAVLLVHVALGAAILAGLNVEIGRRTAERISTFEIAPERPPPPPVQPPPETQRSPAPEEQGAAGRKAEPSAIVAPRPRIPVEPKIAAAPVAGVGSAPSSGAAATGTGTGAGGSGNGRGGGGNGNGDFSGFTPVRMVRNIARRDYRAIARGRLEFGSATAALRIDPNGRVGSCQVIRSSGDPVVDSGLCPLIRDRLLFHPALDDQGRPIPYGIDYVARWSL